MAHGNWVIELAQKSWSEMDDDERKVFDDWLKSSTGRDLFLLVRFALRYSKQSSASTLKAVSPPWDPGDSG